MEQEIQYVVYKNFTLINLRFRIKFLWIRIQHLEPHLKKKPIYIPQPNKAVPTCSPCSNKDLLDKSRNISCLCPSDLVSCEDNHHSKVIQATHGTSKKLTECLQHLALHT